MHFHFPFTAAEILWTLTFAAHLVLLVVLMGRDRIARFPWFTTSVVILALRILTIKLLVHRLPDMTMNIIVIVMADLGALVGLLVVVEIARRAFGRVRRSTWIIGALVLMVVGVAVLKFWGPWPAWKTLTASSTISTLRLLQLIAQKTSLLVDVETIAVGLLIVMLGSRVKAGWRTHTQQIAIGLSTASIAQLVVEGIWQRIVSTAIANPAIAQSITDRDRIIGIGEKLSNTNSSVYVAILIWWIVCLWRDEPGQAGGAADATAKEEQSQAIEAGASKEVGTDAHVTETTESE
jgi:hypothetical protein